MNTLKTLVLALCGAAVAGGIVRMLSPRGGLERVMRAVTGVFFLACLLLPFTDGIDFTVEINSQQDSAQTAARLNEAIEEQTAQLINWRVGEEVKRVVEREWKAGASVRVVSHISDDGDIQIEKTLVELTDAQEADRQRVERSIYDELGITAIVNLK